MPRCAGLPGAARRKLREATPACAGLSGRCRMWGLTLSSFGHPSAAARPGLRPTRHADDPLRGAQRVADTHVWASQYQGVVDDREQPDRRHCCL